MATIRDIARHAGVSPRTVARVLHNKPHVSDRVRRRVKEAVAALRYTPNLIARGMVTGQTGVLALSLTSVTSPLTGPLIKGAMDEARRRGYQLVLCETGPRRAEELEYLILSRSGLVDGVALASHVVDPGVPVGIEELPALSLVNYRLLGHRVPQFMQDCEGDVYLLISHLLSVGARDIAFLSGPAARASTQEKLRGFQRALQDFGLCFSPEQVLHTEYTVEGGRAAMSELSKRGWPQAVFAGNDLIAIGAMQVAKDRGLRIPADLLVCGFDDHPFTAYAEPPLTTVRPDMYGLGRLAIDALLQEVTTRNQGSGYRVPALGSEGEDTPGTNLPAEGGSAARTLEPTVPPTLKRVLVPGHLVIRSSTTITR